MATEKENRAAYVKTAVKYLGAKQGSKKHREIVDIFNSVKPSGEVMNYSAPWCAASVTAWAIKTLGKGTAEKAFPLDYNCGNLIQKAQRLGAWVEKDTYKPTAGDLIIFNWTGGAGEIKVGADHVGVVEKVANGYIHTIEGNYTAASVVGRRSFPVGWGYIRGFIVPRYDKISKPSNDTATAKKPAKTENKGSDGVVYRVNSWDGLNVRKGAGVNYKVITALPDKTKVTITKTKYGWGYCPDLKGWLFMAYLKK